MEIQQSESDGAAVLALSGEIDLHASPALRAKLQSLAGAKPPALLLDFTNVAYIDSSGLATLVEYVRAARAFGGKTLLFGLQPKVKMLFELVRLNELFTITDTRESALAAAASA
jgi:anti-sigma B factor antagonist